ncbi:uncharacterized protein LOC133197059 [Saccostrea echinata]|uniref:uncharacterized protein LOC133197059 n=1 Tax=Saccostrea echinata TaxID=191078 RepID=UPI002A8028EA|nr:uncharacterized protein LOC133197059 [Saccostrea echinata]
MADDVDVDSGITEELEVLKSIYIDELSLKTTESGWPEIISLQLHPSTGDEVEKKYVCITLVLQPTHRYPHEIPSIDIKNPRGVGEEEVNRLQSSLISLATELQGGPMLYDLIELAKDSLTEGNIPHCPCTICYEYFHEGDEFTKTTCYHYFHCQCLSRYIKHVLDTIQQENHSKPTHHIGDDDQTKVPCPVCREEIECNSDMLTREITPEDQMQSFVLTDEMRNWQEKMKRLLHRQRENGGVIDVEEEKNRFLITEDDVVEISNTSTKNQGRESPITKDTESRNMPSKGRGRESQVSRDTEVGKMPGKGRGKEFVKNDRERPAKTKVQGKPKQSPRDTSFRARELTELIQKLEKGNERRQTEFSEEFEALNYMMTSGGSKREGQRPENRHKNRLKHLVPFDNTRVVLSDGDPEIKGSDYICASYIQVVSESERVDRGRVIATQGCLPETVGDLWRMVWQEKSQVIVMATKEQEDNRVKVACYWCDAGKEKVLEGKNYKFLVKGKAVITHKDYILREMEVSKYSTTDTIEGTRLVYQFNYTAWPDFGVPRNPSSIIHFLETVNIKQEELSEAGPMVIHCSAGIGRTGTLVVIETLIYQIKQQGLDCNLDIQKSVLKVRSQRPGLVQTESQYKFIYRAVLCYLQSQPGYTPDQSIEEATLKSSPNKSYREEPQNEKRKEPRGRGRGKQFGWSIKVDKNREDKERGNFSHQQKQEEKVVKQPEDFNNSECLNKKDIHEKDMSVQNQQRKGFGRPQSSKVMEKNKTEQNHTEKIKSEEQPSASKKVEDSHFESRVEKIQEKRQRQGLGRPRSGQQKSHRQTNRHDSPEEGSSNQVQEDNAEKGDNLKGLDKQMERRKGFGKPPVMERSEDVKEGYEKSVRKEYTRRGFGKPSKDANRSDGRRFDKNKIREEERPRSSGGQREYLKEKKCPREEAHRQGSAEAQRSSGDPKDSGKIPDQESRTEGKSKSLLIEKVIKSEPNEGKSDRDFGVKEIFSEADGNQKRQPEEKLKKPPGLNLSETDSDQKVQPQEKLRKPPGFNLSGPPSELVASVRPPPGFSKCS